MTKESLKQTFLELVAINSHHPDEAEIAKYICAFFDRSGIQWKKDSFENIFASIPGEGEPVLLSTHIDIPEPAPHVNPVFEGDIIRSDGTSILGADPKTGLAVILEFARDLKLVKLVSSPNFEQNSDLTPISAHAPVEILLTRGEEKGLLGALNADYSLLKSKIGFCLDEDGPVNQVTVKAPGYVRFDASFTGKVVHTREPEKGINALQVFCHAVRDLPWGYACDGVTWNIGQFQSGTARNSVPRYAEVHAELRGFDTEKLRREAQRIAERFCKTAEQFGATCDVQHNVMFEGYDIDRNHPLFARMNVVYEKMGLTQQYHETYGGSDVNVFIAKGITAVTLGSGYYNAHEYTEYADLADMAQIYTFLTEFLRVQ
ncbi:M20/M25/M40 family metallo-hydrolase [Candidatus Uhrbacteria bacterium]|nr:M20/M25/M40 family metallo-hydrolase [Candidatus Uhrbacteria bacterium]